jgi:hypothetical protein
LSLLGYATLIGQLHIAPSPAFIVNLALTTTFSYLYLRFVTFRRAVRALVGPPWPAQTNDQAANLDAHPAEAVGAK